MSLAEGMKDIAENIIASYETRSRSIGSLFETTHQILEGFQNSFLDTRQEREKINAQLRESLTKNESLRRKDFDHMMQGILSAQEERERQVREGLNSYLAEQREMIHTLGDNLAKFKDALAGGEAQRVKEFQSSIQEILAKQDERKNEVTSQLKEFQKQQQELARTLKELLAKGKELRIKDLKRMLGEFQVRRQERIAGQGERRRDVRDMLDELLKERSAGAKNWQDMQKKMTQARAGLRMDR
jgi:DNA-binding ferritin-like protein (Dps family)